MNKATNYTTDALKHYYNKQESKPGFVLGGCIGCVCWIFILTYVLSFAITTAVTIGVTIAAFNIITMALVEYYQDLKMYDIAASSAQPVN